MLITVAEIKDYLQITSNSAATNDANLATLANYVSTAISSYCGREFDSAFVTEYHNGGTDTVFVDRPPINNVQGISQFNGVEYENLVNSNVLSTSVECIYDHELGSFSVGIVPPKIRVSDALAFNDYRNGVKVEYNGGYVEIPEDLKLAALDWVKILYKQDAGTTSKSFSGHARTATALERNYPPHIKRVLDTYRI